MAESEFQFTPVVTVTERKDGRLDTVFDWGDSYIGPEGPAADVICDAVDQWVKTQPRRIILPRAGTESEAG